jgi:glycosyltransferase involved in cell wall biosynthesis
VVERRIRETYGYKGRAAVLPNAVSEFTAEGAEGCETPARLKPYADRMKLLCLSTYYAHKNLEILVDLFRGFPDELREVVVVTTVAGTENRKARRFLRSIARYGLGDRIVNVGPVPQPSLASYFGSCQGLLLPTLLESFSGTYLEAMYFGVPILTSDLDFAREVCGDAAIYFDPWDPASIKDAILRLRNDPQSAQDMVARGRERLKAMFRSWDEIARKVAALLAEMADKQPAGRMSGRSRPSEVPAREALGTDGK